MAYEDSVIEDSNPVTVITIDSGRVKPSLWNRIPCHYHLY